MVPPLFLNNLLFLRFLQKQIASPPPMTLPMGMSIFLFIIFFVCLYLFLLICSLYGNLPSGKVELLDWDLTSQWCLNAGLISVNCKGTDVTVSGHLSSASFSTLPNIFGKQHRINWKIISSLYTRQHYCFLGLYNS